MAAIRVGASVSAAPRGWKKRRAWLERAREGVDRGTQAGEEGEGEGPREGVWTKTAARQTFVTR